MITDVWEQHYRMERYRNWRFPNVVQVIDDNGKEASEGAYGQRGVGPGELYGMFIDKDFIKSTKTLHVNLSNITSKVLGPWSGKATVKK